MVRITKTYYDALEEGTILGRKCTRCGHIEFPPYLCCNECGGLDTEWVDLTNMRGIVKQALPTKGAFGDPEFRNTQGDYFAVEIEVPGIDPFNASLLHVDYDKYAEFDQYIQEHEVEVKPLLFQDEDVKVVAWELVQEDSGDQGTGTKERRHKNSSSNCNNFCRRSEQGCNHTNCY